ncbi:MAG: TonB-dependent receptor [Bacteroidota bacterium]|nr:MAG: TonB-dependent receptor [Bacteroidota bacterium]
MRLKLYMSLLGLFFVMIAAAQNGSVRGMVFEEATGEYLPGVAVYADGTSIGTITDLDGAFNLSLQPGIYTIKISFISFETIEISGVEIKAGQPTQLGEIQLKEVTFAINAVTVTAKSVRNTETAMLSVKSKSPNLIDGISAGSLKRTGDSDAAGAMKRIPGVSVSGGKYAYVRGLGDRYTKTILNGVEIPGLDPDRNSLQIDIFPTNIIDNIIVYKSFSAELPADFTGGLIDISIKDFPEGEEGKLSLSAGYNNLAHFNSEYLTYTGGKTDFLGFDDGTRAIPATENIPQFAEVVGNPNGTKGQRYQEILRSFNPEMSANQQTSFMDYSFGVTYGNQVAREKVTLGYNFALSYKNITEFYKDAIDARYGLSGDPGVYEMNRREYQKGDIGENNVLLSGLGGFAIKTSNSKVGLNILHLQNGEKKSGIFDFIGSDQGSDFISFQHGLDYSQRSMTNLLFDGKHKLSDNKWSIDWKISPTFSKISDPDIRFSRYEINDDGTFRIGTEVGFPERIWRELDELNVAGLFHITKEFTLNTQKSKLLFGGGYTYKNRSYIIRNFAINPRGGFPLSGNPDELFYEENLWPKDDNTNIGTTYETPFIPTNPNQYDAIANNLSGYVSTELGLTSKFKAIVGVRVENFTQYYTGSDQQRIYVLNNEKVLDDFNIFPAINLLYKLNAKQNLRASFTQTIARPSFKELSYAEIYDPISGVTFIGGFHRDGDDVAGVEYWDGNLVSTHIQNFDLRWELFQEMGQMFSVSAFYKTFDNPIEIVQYTKQIGAFQPRNVGDGSLVGAEFELRQNFGFISPEISMVQVNANLTFTQSQIELSNTEFDSREDNARTGQSISQYREMAGQAPYIFNGGISYSGAEEGFWKRVEVGLFYNLQGKTLEYVGAADRPDIYSKPFHSLNFNSEIKIGKNNRTQIGFKIDNMLGSKKESVYQSYEAADQLFKSRTPGTVYTIRLGYNFL